jgi:CRISPR/Cas system-associated exonuclease Cas4 (RecB family)
MDVNFIAVPAQAVLSSQYPMGDSFRNKFTWSVSRDDTFLECPRKYWFNYYGFWGGWEIDTPERVRQIYVLKQVKSRAMWAGQVVHDCIKRSLDNISRGIPVLALDEILSITRDRMRADFRSSRAGAYWNNPKNNCGLYEHEYDLEVPDEQWRETADRVDTCLKNFYNSETYETLRRLPRDDFLEIEQFSGFDLDGENVVIKLDCATRHNDRIVVWDWKTGRLEQTGLSFQMACYAYYASNVYRVPVDHVVTRRFELLRNELVEEKISEGALDELLTYIRGSIADMKALLDDPRRNTTTEGRFAKVEKRETCYRCNFLKICKPDL